jgi:thymidylate synthase
MYVIDAVNVCDALPRAISYLIDYGKKENTRVGPALVAQIPVAIRYQNPKQHVLTNPVRDANPFFHLMEAMWMLSGRNDGAFLDHYIKNFSKDFGINGKIPDAYGYRWRYALGYDQLLEIIRQLRLNPSSRQCVLQMWGAGRDDLLADKARACNLVATFRIREDCLDMTVFNRSNDLIWGCCGANAVHFAIMQEYIASMIGIKIGSYWQVSTNLHLYESHIQMFRKRIVGDEEITIDVNYAGHLGAGIEQYGSTQPLINHPGVFDKDLEETMDWIHGIHRNKEYYDGNLSNQFLRDTILPMALAHQLYKNKDMKKALEVIQRVTAHDWRKAGKEWLLRREKQ